MKLIFSFALLVSFGSLSSFTNTSDIIVSNGEKLYKNYCTICHGDNGKLSIGEAPDLTKSSMSLKERINIIKKGKGMMAPFQDLLSEKEIKAISKYTMTLQ